MALYFEDFTPGRRFKTGGFTLTEAQILDFAFTYDPQPFHLDKTLPDNPFGGLIASGFQTLLVGFRMFYQANIINACNTASPGMDEVRWLKPVFPEDTLHVEAEVAEQTPSSKKPDRGRVILNYAVVNQSGEAVMTFRIIHIFKRRPEGPDPQEG